MERMERERERERERENKREIFVVTMIVFCSDARFLQCHTKQVDTERKCFGQVNFKGEAQFRRIWDRYLISLLIELKNEKVAVHTPFSPFFPQRFLFERKKVKERNSFRETVGDLSLCLS